MTQPTNPNPKAKPTNDVGKSYKAWEDGHWVSKDSPEVAWYLYADGRWCVDPIDSWTINPPYFDRAVGASWGFDWENLDGFLNGFGDGFSKGGGDMISGFINAGHAQGERSKANLRQEILVARNAWCRANGIPIPVPGSLGPTGATPPASSLTSAGGELLLEGSAVKVNLAGFKQWLIDTLGK